jgi:ribosome-binding protein aMBF1 (putative translation factor)
MERDHLVPEPAGEPEPAAADRGASLPVMPGFREMALRRSADEQATRMAEERGRLVRELAGRRQAAGLSQTEIAARMGTSQSAVARLESGTADVRASTLERYAAAVGGQITWKLSHPEEGTSQ